MWAGLPRRRPGDDAVGLPAGVPAGRGQLPQRRPDPGRRGQKPRLRACSRRSGGITLGQAKVAILGGCLLVVMVMMAEYGAFEILGYQTFTTEIFSEFQQVFDISSTAPCALSLVLVALSLLVLAGEGMLRGGMTRDGGRVSRSGPMAQRVNPPQQLGWARWPVLAAQRRARPARARPSRRVDAVLDGRRPAAGAVRRGQRIPARRGRAHGSLRRRRRRPWPR